jgi:hypothetical protein
MHKANAVSGPSTVNKFANETRPYVITPRFDAVTHNDVPCGVVHIDSRLKDITR